MHTEYSNSQPATFQVKGHGNEEFRRVFLRAWQCDPREKIHFRVEIAGDQGILLLNPRIRRVRRTTRTQPEQGVQSPNYFLYDLPADNPEGLISDLALFSGCHAARIRMLSRPSNVEIALLNRAELRALTQFAAGKHWRAFLPFIFPPQSEWCAGGFLDCAHGRFTKCVVWLSIAEAKRVVLEKPESAESFLAVRCPGVEAEFPAAEKIKTVMPGAILGAPAKPALENCPRCNGQTEMNGDGRLVCHFCGHVFGSAAPRIPAAA